MKKAALVVLLMLCVGCFSRGSLFSSGDPVQNHPETSNKDMQQIKKIMGDGISAFFIWGNGGSPTEDLLCVVKDFEQDKCFLGKGTKLSIYHYTGDVLYEECFQDIFRLYTCYALRGTDLPQLVIETGDGGTTSHLSLLNYQSGKITDLLESIKPNHEFDARAEIRAQFRNGVNPSKEAFQILLTTGGLAGASEKYTTVFRYQNGRYKKVGKVSQRKIDDYIEELLKQDQSRR